MSVQVRVQNWAKILKFFSDRNQGRLTRLGVCERGAKTDKRIASGLPLLGIDADARGDGGAAAVEIMLGDAARNDARRFAHNIHHARRVKLHFSSDGNGDAVKIEDAEGRTTVLRFEN